MPRGNKGRTGMRKTTHRRHHRTQKHRIGNSNTQQTPKNRTTTPFDIESEISNFMRREHRNQVSTNPFGRTAEEIYGIDTANVSGKEISRLASRLQKKRDRRIKKGKNELTQQERDLREQTRNDFLEAMMELKPKMWNEEAWRREAEISTNPGLSSPTRKNLLKELDLMPITEVIITEVEDEPSLNLSKASLFSRRKSMKSRIAEGNKKKKRKRKKRVTKKRKRKRKRKKR